ncbi:MAG TPA: DUF3303 family protein [Phycisphaerales bacterium]|nr:DUF3303 family protein [Phycisphaerales bacterium]
MLFMVIETFPVGLEPVRERFQTKGRMLPPNVSYIASWLEPDGSRCFQLMEAPDREALQPWVDAWKDIGGFDIRPVLTSADFWSAYPKT